MGEEKTAPLEDLMVAMDVVDTLRHRQQLIDRELDADARRERLIEKLREIYRAQGIEVSDQVLADGVKALEEDRFKYTAPEKTFSTLLATVYVKRDRWLKPFLLLLILLTALWASYHMFVIRPQQLAQNALPDDLRQRYEEVLQLTDDNAALARAHELQTSGKQALHNGHFDEARSSIEALERLLARLKQVYTIRVVQRLGERSGVWRVPDVNTRARNYYLIVEALDPKGNVISLPITSEETGKTTMVDRWGLRVDKTTYQRIATDKRDDGIIQNRVLGEKKRGQLEPEYRIPTTGAAITEW